MDQAGKHASVPIIPIDLTLDTSVAHAFDEFRRIHGTTIASVIHLAGYFDLTGKDNPLYHMPARSLHDARKRHGTWMIEIIRRSDTAKGFQILPRRWVVERTFAWLGRCRRLPKDWETSIPSATASAYIANIRILTRRIPKCWYHA